jgi:hypothetical protein
MLHGPRIDRRDPQARSATFRTMFQGARESYAMTGDHPDKKEVRMPRTKEQDDQRSIDLNPNSDPYWQSRGYDERPDDWEEKITEDQDSPQEKE